MLFIENKIKNLLYKSDFIENVLIRNKYEIDDDLNNLEVFLSISRSSKGT